MNELSEESRKKVKSNEDEDVNAMTELKDSSSSNIKYKRDNNQSNSSIECNKNLATTELEYYAHKYLMKMDSNKR